MSPLIVRQVGPLAPALPLEEEAVEIAPTTLGGWVEDAKLFMFGWLGGLVFFGTLIG